VPDSYGESALFLFMAREMNGRIFPSLKASWKRTFMCVSLARAIAGSFDPKILDVTDETGTTVAAALLEAGLATSLGKLPGQIADLAYKPSEVAGAYCPGDKLWLPPSVWKGSSPGRLQT
jgi:hypothetical protein